MKTSDTITEAKSTMAAFKLTAADIDIATGFDTFLHRGWIPTLVYRHRDKFFAKYPKLYQTLQQCQPLPLIEEAYDPLTRSRGRRGEYQLIRSQLKALVQKKILAQPKSNYDTSNVWCIDSPEALDQRLKLTPLTNGASIKVLHFNKIHTNTFFIAKVAGRIKILLFDALGVWLYHPRWQALLAVMNAHFPGADVFYCADKLQHDYYSCGVFAFKVLRHLVKQGGYFFKKKLLQPICSTQVETLRCHQIQQLPSYFYKLAQGSYSLSKESLQQIVSSKKGCTLHQYQQAHTRKFIYKNKQRTYQFAALKKRYQYLNCLTCKP